MLKQKKLIIGGIIILAAIGILSFISFKGAATYYYTVSEVLTTQSNLGNQNIRVAGKVIEGSIVREKSGNTIVFILADLVDPTKRVNITYQGAVPDAFKEGNEAVVEGKFSDKDTFKAQQIIVKCPSKYVPKE